MHGELKIQIKGSIRIIPQLQETTRDLLVSVCLLKTYLWKKIHYIKSCAGTLRSGKENNAGIWRFNNSLLSENELKTKLIHKYIMYNDTEEINVVILWEGSKVVLRGEIISKKMQENVIKKMLEKEQ